MPNRRSTRAARWARRASRGSLIVGLVFLAMVPFSYFRYTSLGVDTDRGEGVAIIQKFVRIRWPGDGSFRVGCGKIRYVNDTETVTPIDFAGKFFLVPENANRWRELRPPTWHRFGCSVWIADGLQGVGHTKWSVWVGIPSWAPAIVMLGLSVLTGKMSNRGHDPEAESRVSKHAAK